VTSGSPADKAGLKVGDVVLSVGDVHAPIGDKAAEKLLRMLQSEIKANGNISFLVSRSGVEQTVQVQPEVACDYPVLLGPGDEVNAFADGEKIVIQKGMLRFVESDAELATVIGHELAHNAMGHITAKKTNYALGSIFDIAAALAGVNTQGAFGNAAASAYSKEFEAEADYVGLYSLALADLPIDESANLWRRMAAEGGANIKTQYSSTHPGSADRYLALEAAAHEIHTKRAAGEMLKPNLKKQNQKGSETN
jgi:predicted Zn-dependent protease